jgi:hypothetical protein
MDTLKHNKHHGYHISALEVFVSFLIGVAVVGFIWFFTGLLIGLLV